MTILPLLLFAAIAPGSITVPVKVGRELVGSVWWSPAEQAQCPPWLDLRPAEIARTVPLRRLHPWLPEGAPTWIYRDNRGLAWARRRGLLRVGDVAIVERQQATKGRLWFDVRIVLTDRKAGGRFWKTVGSEADIAKMRVIRAVESWWAPMVKNNQGEP